MHILEGFFIGIATIIFIGPVLFILINASINNGIVSGFSVALGIIIGDIIFAFISFNGVSLFLNNNSYNYILSIIGVLILFFMGFIYLFKKEAAFNSNIISSNKTHFQNFLKGFAINFFNPFVFAYWILFSKYAENKFGGNATIFIAAMLFGIFFIDLFKVFLSKKLIPFLNFKRLLFFYKVAGIIMIFFALRIMFSFLL